MPILKKFLRLGFDNFVKYMAFICEHCKMNLLLFKLFWIIVFNFDPLIMIYKCLFIYDIFSIFIINIPLRVLKSKHKPWVDKIRDLHTKRVCKLRRSKPVWSRLCWIQLYHVFTSLQKVLGPTWHNFGWTGVWHVLRRPQHRPGSPKQAQTWPTHSDRRIVKEAPAFQVAGARQFCFVSDVQTMTHARSIQVIRWIVANAK